MVTDELPEEDMLPDEEELEGREDSEEEDGTEALPLELLGWELELDDELFELMDAPALLPLAEHPPEQPARPVIISITAAKIAMVFLLFIVDHLFSEEFHSGSCVPGEATRKRGFGNSLHRAEGKMTCR